MPVLTLEGADGAEHKVLRSGVRNTVEINWNVFLTRIRKQYGETHNQNCTVGWAWIQTNQW
jgi:hypothetical protein